MPAREEELVCLAVVAAAHGIGGQLKLRCFTEVAEDIAAYGPLTDDAGRIWRVRVRAPVKGGVIAEFEGIRDRTAAERLKGQKLHVARGALPEPEEESYYHSDLIGLEARAADGRPLGRIVAVHDFGAGDLIELGLADGRRELLPFTTERVPVVDLAAGYVVAVPEGEDGGDGQ